MIPRTIEMRLIRVKTLFEIPLTRPTDARSPSDGEREGVKGIHLVPKATLNNNRR